MVAFRFGELYHAEDCTIGNHAQNQNLLGPDANLNTEVVRSLRTALFDRVAQVNTELMTRISEDERSCVFESCVEHMHSALRVTSDDWKAVFPGRYLLQRFASAHSLGKWPALQNVLIDRLSRGDIPVHVELRRIFEAITSGAGGPNNQAQATQ